ncbi:MAG: hypothetical protein IPP71_20920 [Bacteroidetes bacterium]|nr:hypothetical protein [Bacteroidota bacterium]
MKKLTIIIVAACCSPKFQLPKFLGFGQNFGTNIAFDYVGTTDPASFGFRTNALPRMQIFEPFIPAFNTGFLGIGDYTVFNPAANVHAHNSTSNDFVSFKASSANTGFLRNDGFPLELLEAH